MRSIATYDRLLAALRERIFKPLDAEVPLRFRRAENGDRAKALGEARDGWTPVDRDLVWG